MPRTKLAEEFASKEPNEKVCKFTLADIPDLPATITIEKAAAITGVGYQGIKFMLDNDQLPYIASGKHRYIPTWEFLVTLKIFPETMMEKAYLLHMELEHRQRVSDQLQVSDPLQQVS
jgi:hypothetical protein